MNELLIDPRVQLTDPEAAKSLERKRRKLFDSQYRPAHPLVEHRPSPPGEHFFGMPLGKLRLVK